MPTLSQIWIHPVKSLAGIRVDSAEARERGLRDDRAWVVVGLDRVALTQRGWPRLALVSTSVDRDGLTLTAAESEPLRVSRRTTERCRAVVWGDEVDGADGGDMAADWLSAFLGTDCRLVYMDEQARRVTYPDGGAGRSVRFADELPLLVVSQAGLAEIEQRTSGLGDVRRFRPNLVIDGCEPYAEDRWKRLRIGDAEIEVVKPASRCVLVNVDPDTGMPHPGGEPLRTLAAYRRTSAGDYEHKPERVYLGVRAAIARAGDLRVGDPVEVLA